MSFVIALAGNPNTGKSTVFNALTGLKQHTGNWSGKTVVTAEGYFEIQDTSFKIVDLPGIYSLFSDSAEERCAKDFICLEKPDVTVVVLDSTCLERNLNLALQVMELTKNVIVCLNLIDEAESKQIIVDDKKLSKLLGIPVIRTNAREGVGLENLKSTIMAIAKGELNINPILFKYPRALLDAIDFVDENIYDIIPEGFNSKWISELAIEKDPWIYNEFAEHTKLDKYELIQIEHFADEAIKTLEVVGMSSENFKNEKSLAVLRYAEKLANDTVTIKCNDYDKKERKIDRLIFSKTFGIPFMLCLLGVIFWITIVGANYPSSLLMRFFAYLSGVFNNALYSINCPPALHGLIMDGIFLTVSWVVAVMLPPMAIFFPLFTLLEDVGLLPRIAFNLDGLFKRAGAHGKQSLTMWLEYRLGIHKLYEFIQNI